MVYRKGPGDPQEREAFMETNTELLERCCAVPSKERKQHMRDLVVKARAHFGYSMKTIAYDILRPVLKAYARYRVERYARCERNSLLEYGQEDTRGPASRPVRTGVIEAGASH